MKTKESIQIEVGPAKIKGGNSAISYIAVIGFIVIILFYIYAKFMHQKVKDRIIRRRKK